MRHTLKWKTALITVLGLILLPQLAYGIGYEVTEHNAKAMGLASAFVAWADNPSAIYYNPAGLTQTDRPEASLGVTLINLDLRLTNNGNREKDKTQDFYVPNFFSSIPVRDDLVFGLGVYSPYGLGTEWDEDGITKYAAIKSELQTIFVTPVLAYTPIPEVSVGVGLSYVYADAEMTQKYPFSVFGLGPDADVRVTGKDHNWSWTAGILAQPTDKLNLGFSYRSKTELKLKGDFDVDNGPAGTSYHTNAEFGLSLPHRFSFGINYKVLPNWRVEFDYERIRWSALDSLDVNIDDEIPGLYEDIKTEKDWRDTNTFKLGTELQLSEGWALRAGSFYYQTAIPDKSLDPMIPENDRYGFTLGVGYKIGDFSVDVGYMDIFSRPRTVDNDSLEGPILGQSGLTTTPGNDRYETHFRQAAVQLSYIF